VQNAKPVERQISGIGRENSGVMPKRYVNKIYAYLWWNATEAFVQKNTRKISLILHTEI